MPHAAREPRDRHVQHLPQAGVVVGVLPPHVHVLRKLSYGPLEALRRIMRSLPHAVQALRKRGVHPSGRLGDMHLMPLEAGRALHRKLHHVPQAGVIVGVLPPHVHVLCKLPHRTVQPLRNVVRLVSLTVDLVGQRHVQPSPNPGRGTHLQELLLRDVPPGRLYLVFMFGLP